MLLIQVVKDLILLELVIRLYTLLLKYYGPGFTWSGWTCSGRMLWMPNPLWIARSVDVSHELFDPPKKPCKAAA